MWLRIGHEQFSSFTMHLLKQIKRILIHCFFFEIFNNFYSYKPTIIKNVNTTITQQGLIVDNEKLVSNLTYKEKKIKAVSKQRFILFHDDQ